MSTFVFEGVLFKGSPTRYDDVIETHESINPGRFCLFLNLRGSSLAQYGKKNNICVWQLDRYDAEIKAGEQTASARLG